MKPRPPSEIEKKMELFESNIEQEGDGHYKVMLPWNSKKHLLIRNDADGQVIKKM